MNKSHHTVTHTNLLFLVQMNRPLAAIILALSAAVIGGAFIGVALVVVAYALAIIGNMLLAKPELMNIVRLQQTMLFEAGAIVGVIMALYLLYLWWDRIWSGYLGFSK